MFTGLSAQTYQFQGSWIKLNTTYVFEFDLILNHSKSNNVEGHFIWQVVRYDEGSFLSKSHYADKIGLTAKEFVKGRYNPSKKVYFLDGYRKEDPNNIIGLDTYRIKVDKNGDIGGNTKANNSWKGIINGKNVSMLVI